MKQGSFLLLDGNRGIYLPKVFAMMFGDSLKEASYKPEDINLLILGPHENEHYWEVWDDVLMNAIYVNGEKEYSLIMDENLFAEPI